MNFRNERSILSIWYNSICNVSLWQSCRGRHFLICITVPKGLSCAFYDVRETLHARLVVVVGGAQFIQIRRYFWRPFSPFPTILLQQTEQPRPLNMLEFNWYYSLNILTILLGTVWFLWGNCSRQKEEIGNLFLFQLVRRSHHTIGLSTDCRD